MKKTSRAQVAALVVFVALASFIVVRRFYGDLLPTSWLASVFLWLLAIVCAVMGKQIRAAVDQGRIGFDRSQFGPSAIAAWLAVGRGAIYTGAIVGAVYLGLTGYLLLHVSTLVAAAEDLPGSVASLLAGGCCMVAGFYLESACEAPPPPSAEAAQ
ncbi:DUF3180 domain-containing protein [Corynebacterium choanae]|uniref:DUF3180 domain-containing protein n=1 Tax=Corynebacterium choanae TaxID=1862358 RepID=A0A3G6J4U2_9CORY|nr:DUF3180 domain-containing protein [Corynebacterium choanae]AZA12753.1 hypothetical protein CCHOA_01625 [Corynebacterium choanae]